MFAVDEGVRIPQMIRVEVLGQPLSEKYAWAIPNEAALQVLSHFSPLIEIGCGILGPFIAPTRCRYSCT